MEKFVIQLHTERQHGSEASHAELRGLVEHVATGRRQRFTDARQLLAFFQADYAELRKRDDDDA